MPSRNIPPVWLAPAVLGAVLSVAGLVIVYELGAPPSATQSAEDTPVAGAPTPTAAQRPSEPAASPEAGKPPAPSQSAAAPPPQPDAQTVKPPVVVEATPAPQPSAEAVKPPVVVEATPAPQPSEPAHASAKPNIADLAKPAPPAPGQAQEDVGRAAVEGEGAVGRRKPATVAVSRASFVQRARRETQLCPTADDPPLAPLPQFAPRRTARFSARWR